MPAKKNVKKSPARHPSHRSGIRARAVRSSRPDSAPRLRVGWIILDASSASGGIHHHRTILEDNTDQVGENDPTEKRWETQRVVDHKRLVKELDGVVKKVDHVLRKECSRLSKFYFADDNQLRAVREKIARIQEEAERLNNEAARERCGRRAYISIMPNKIDLAQEDVAREVGRTITETLQEVCALIQAGDVGSKLEQILRLRVKNLHKLCVGFHGQYLVEAYNRAVEARKEVREAIKKGRTPESAGRSVDLTDVENAITMFEPFEAL